MSTVTIVFLVLAVICFFLAFIKGWAFSGADKLDLMALGWVFFALSFLIH